VPARLLASDKSMLWTYISLLPMIVAYTNLLASALMHKLSYLKYYMFMGFAFIFSEDILKYAFKGKVKNI
jgi:hypothetical protein